MVARRPLCHHGCMLQDTGIRTVHAACPHDCPDTCAMRVTVQDGRVVRIQGDPEHPPTHGALCTKVSRYAERTVPPRARAAPAAARRPEGPRAVRTRGLGRGAARHRRAAARHRRARPAGDPALQLRRHDGPGAGREHGGALLPRLGASLLDRTICSSAGGEALAATYGAKLGMHVEHFAESRLILVWGSNSITSNLHFWTFAQQAKRAGARLVCIDPRRTETADKCHQHIALLPGTDGALALGLMHELSPTTGSTTTTWRAMSTAGPRCANARCSGRPSAWRRSAASPPTSCAAWRATTARRSRRRSA
jgi:hypothetical protein